MKQLTFEQCVEGAIKDFNIRVLKDSLYCVIITSSDSRYIEIGICINFSKEVYAIENEWVYLDEGTIPELLPNKKFGKDLVQMINDWLYDQGLPEMLERDNAYDWTGFSLIIRLR